MKTKYKHIYFVETNFAEGKSFWCRNNKSNAILGLVEYYIPWKRYVFEGRNDCVFDTSCLQDIIHFIGQL